MWIDSNRRRWLVRGRGDKSPESTTITSTATVMTDRRLSISNVRRKIYACRTDQDPAPATIRPDTIFRKKIKLKNALRSRTTPASFSRHFVNCPSITSTTITTATATKASESTSTSTSIRVKSCLNQILEVLLVILLVNCIALPSVIVPTVRAARSGSPTATAPDQAEMMLMMAAGTAGAAMPQLRLLHSSDRQNSRSLNADDVYRRPLGYPSSSSSDGGGDFSISALGFPGQSHKYLGPDGSDVSDSVDVSAMMMIGEGPNPLQRSLNFKISPKPCSSGRIEGTCMFVWECIKSEGRHVGMCVDSFMFGSCCAHNYTDNIVVPQVFSYTRPTKPVGISSLNHRPRPPHLPHKPSISGMTTIERPHGAGTLVIRPSGPHHQGALHRPLQHSTRPPVIALSSSTTTSSTTSTSTEISSQLPNSSGESNDLQSAASASVSASAVSNGWSHHTTPPPPYQNLPPHIWQMTSEPNFITKPRPPTWEKPYSSHKPSKPSKKPIIVYEDPAYIQEHHLQQQYEFQTPSLVIVYTTQKPTTSMLQHQQFLPPQKTKPTKFPSMTRPYTRPTPSWGSVSSSSSSSSSTTTTASGTTSALGQPMTGSTPPWHSSTTQKERPTSFETSTSHLPSPVTLGLLSTTTTTTERPASSSTSAYTTSISSSSLTTSGMSSSLPSTTSSAFSSSPSSSLSSSSAASTSSVSTPTYTTSSSTQSHFLAPQHLATVESNEIADASSSASSSSSSSSSSSLNGETVVKTISAARNNVECGLPALVQPETRIVGGRNAGFGRWPWQVSVRRTTFFGFSSTHRCGGALINENWIATAGHCVDDLLLSQIRIRVGEYDFSHMQEQMPYIERGVVKKVVHPKYNYFTYEYDLALVKLDQPLEFKPHVSPICLPQTDSLLIGMNATVTGWGRLQEGGTLPSVLQEVSVPIVSNDNCKSMFQRAGRQEFIPEIFLCAGYETGGQDSCQGDSGGPLQVKSQNGRYFLAGIISWGIGCAEANLPGVCTRISKFVPWILENVT